jgi:type I restriction enzyme S subunit
MELRPQYKQTEVGVIPEDWRVTSIGERCCVVGRIGFRGYTVNDIVKPGKGAIAISPSNIQDGTTTFTKCTYISFAKYEESPEIKIDNGDILLVKTGSTFGKTAIVRNLPEKATLNPQVVVLKKRKADAFFLGYMMGFETIQKQIAKAIVGGALPTLSQALVSQFKFPEPPTSAEQCAIATALSDVDALLRGLDQLIAKKRDLKQAAMQQLLTGQTRLPGFSGEWKVTRLGDCLLSRPEYGINAAAVPFADKLPSYIRITDISEEGRFCPNPRVSVNAVGSDQYYLREGDVVFARTGASVGKSYLYQPCDGKLVFAGFLIRVSPNPKFLVPAFLSTYAMTKPYWNWVRLMSMRSGQPGINGNEYAQMPLSLPGLREQVAITAVLSDMDAELVSLAERRDKTRALKQAMMQALLTGKTRLVIAKVGHA